MQNLAAEWFRNGAPSKLILTGQSGCGKTELAKNLARFAVSAALSAWDRGFYSGPPSISFIYWPDICSKLEEPCNHMTDVLQDACTASLSIIDDIGAESDRYKSGKPTEALCYLLTRRQDFGQTLLTTNVLPSLWDTRWDARVEDRLHRNSVICDMHNCPKWSSL